jgi:hypothetical protein
MAHEAHLQIPAATILGLVEPPEQIDADHVLAPPKHDEELRLDELAG